VTLIDAINVKHNVNNMKMIFSADDHTLIKLLRQETGCAVKKFVAEFPSKPWTLSGLNKRLRKMTSYVLG